ncbi:MAG: Zn-ribbon domain-containing OB-fold protein [Actinomycetota bacterium]|nr:Zn-ribbon domain-containing OB-fold protein [Actinomycetota bacterium]
MEVSEEVFFTPTVPLDFTYNYRVGSHIGRYLEGFKEKKIMGVKCPKCGKVFVPPRMFCGPCNQKLEDFVELSQEGELRNYTVGHVNLVKGRLEDSDTPYVLGMIQLDGADSLFLTRVEGVPSDEVERGTRMKAVWKDQVEGDCADLDHFEPV